MRGIFWRNGHTSEQVVTFLLPTHIICLCVALCPCGTGMSSRLRCDSVAVRDRRLNASLTWRCEEEEEEIELEGDHDGRDQLPELKALWKQEEGVIPSEKYSTSRRE